MVNQSKRILHNPKHPITFDGKYSENAIYQKNLDSGSASKEEASKFFTLPLIPVTWDFSMHRHICPSLTAFDLRFCAVSPQEKVVLTAFLILHQKVLSL
jgi:hypothetical protein